MNRFTQQRLQPASLTTGAAVSMASTGTGHIERQSQIRLRKIHHSHQGREEKDEGESEYAAAEPSYLFFSLQPCIGKALSFCKQQVGS